MIKVKLWKFLEDLSQIVLDKAKLLAPGELIGLILAVAAIIWLVTTSRTDKQIQDAFVLSKEKDCQIELAKVRIEKDYDNNKNKLREDSIVKYFSNKQDYYILEFINMKAEIKSLKRKK